MTDMDSSDSNDSDRGIRYKTESVKCTMKSMPNIEDELESNKNSIIKNKRRSQDNSDGIVPQTVQHLGGQYSIGPALPPNLRKDNSIGPVLPPHLQKDYLIGPALPPHLEKKTQVGLELPSHSQQYKSINDQNVQNQTETTKTIGPALPPGFSSKSESTTKMVGPALPPHLQILRENEDSNTGTITVTEYENHIGPALPDYLQHAETCEDEEDVYGPVPLGSTQTKSHIELEERALQMKIDMLTPAGEKEPVREEWMLELPAAKAANFGLGPRQFRAKAAPDLSDRSSWTDTPEEKTKKKEKQKEPVNLKQEAELKEMHKRDKEQETIVKKHKRSKESLVEMHMKKTKKDESGPSERRPFSREVDLQVNRFDEAQKKAVLKKAQLLDTRFSAGQSKFL